MQARRPVYRGLQTVAVSGLVLASTATLATSRRHSRSLPDTTPSASLSAPNASVSSQNALPAPPSAPAPLITEGVTFAPNAAFAKGQATRYASQSSMTLRFPGQNGGVSSFTATISMSLTLRYKVRDAKPDGVSQVAVLSEGGRLLDATSAFHDIPKETDNAARLLTLDRQSHIIAFKDPTLKGKNDSKSGGLDALFTQSNLLVPLHILPLPAKTVRVGESWTARYASPGKNLSAEESGESSDGEDVRATLTLLGSEKIGDVNTLKIKQVLTVPYTAYTDAQGKLASAKGAQGRMTMQLTFTQLVNALPESGLLVRSEGAITGTVKFEGALLKQLPGDTMTIGGTLVAVRIDDIAPETAPAAK